jgi:hypothetical protein
VKPSNHSSQSAPLCPSCSPQVPMVPADHEVGNRNSHELLVWHCSHCAHQGMTAKQGIQLVFRGGEEYVFAYGSSSGMLTVALSSEAIALFKSHHIGADELARRAAEWALLRGRVSGTVTLGLQHEELAAFYWYFYHTQAVDRQAV